MIGFLTIGWTAIAAAEGRDLKHARDNLKWFEDAAAELVLEDIDD